MRKKVIYYLSTLGILGAAEKIPLNNKAFSQRSGENTYFPSIQEKKKLENFCKHSGSSPRKENKYFDYRFGLAEVASERRGIISAEPTAKENEQF